MAAARRPKECAGDQNVAAQIDVVGVIPQNPFPHPKCNSQ
jgi:hypothetical protein